MGLLAVAIPALLVKMLTSGGHCKYRDEAVDRVILIQELLAAGLSTTVFEGLLPCLYSGTTTPAMVLHLKQQREKNDRKAYELLPPWTALTVSYPRHGTVDIVNTAQPREPKEPFGPQAGQLITAVTSASIRIPGSNRISTPIRAAGGVVIVSSCLAC